MAAGNKLRMSPIGTDDFWEDLLDFIEQGKVIPVIGEHAVTFSEGKEPLYPWLARLHAVCDPGGRLTMPPKLETLLQYARAERFIPFTIIFSSGTNYPIQNRDLISVPPPDKTDEGNQYAEMCLGSEQWCRVRTVGTALIGL
jgi:hypothetical protein